MAFTPIPTVVAGQKITATQGNKYATGITELQGEWPDAATTWVNPTVAGLTKGDGTETARIVQLGPCKLVLYRFVLGTTSAITGDLSLILPTSMAFAGAGFGAGYFESGVSRYDVAVYGIGTANILLRPVKTDGAWGSVANGVSASVPETWVTGDIINVGYVYLEA